MTAKTTASAGKTVGKTVGKKTTARKSGKASKAASGKLTAAQKHTAHVKHEEHLAHEAHLTAIGKAPKVALARAGDGLPVCAFEAIGMSLRLAGLPVHDDDVAGLWELAGADPDGASIGDALAAAALFGLARYRPAAYDLHSRYGDCGLGQLAGDDADLAPLAVEAQALPPILREAFLHGPVGQAVQPHALILGVDRPGPHAVLATDRGWWSWGELHDPWPCRVTGAWAVSRS